MISCRPRTRDIKTFRSKEKSKQGDDPHIYFTIKPYARSHLRDTNNDYKMTGGATLTLSTLNGQKIKLNMP